MTLLKQRPLLNFVGVHRSSKMPIQTPQWTEYLSCPVCENGFELKIRLPISLGCGHTICKTCLSNLQRSQCPFDLVRFNQVIFFFLHFLRTLLMEIRIISRYSQISLNCSVQSTFHLINFQ